MNTKQRIKFFQLHIVIGKTEETGDITYYIVGSEHRIKAPFERVDDPEIEIHLMNTYLTKGEELKGITEISHNDYNLKVNSNEWYVCRLQSLK